MPIEFWILAAVAVAAAVGGIAGIWLGRRQSSTAMARPAPQPEPMPAHDGVSERVVSGSPDLAVQLVPADQLGIGLLRVDADGTIRAANKLATDLVSMPSHKPVGRSLLEAFVDHGVEALAVRARREGQATGEHVQSGEPPRTLSLHAWLASDGDVWIALTDVSELRRLRRIRTEFVDNLSHELRTPLTTMRLLTESLSLEAEQTDLPPRVRESISKIDVETGHLVQMVNELLDLAKIEQGEAPIRQDSVSLARVVHETTGRLTTYAQRQGVDLAEDIGTSGDESLVVGDENRLSQALTNIVHNAVKFSPSGAGVLVHLAREDDEVIVSVEDDGPGIARADHDRIFERFYKVDRARARGRGGTGLGLAIARHIVERHGGRLWVESDEGAGSMFFIGLPAARSTAVRSINELETDTR